MIYVIAQLILSFRFYLLYLPLEVKYIGSKSIKFLIFIEGSLEAF